MKPFKIEVPQATLDGIRARVAAYAWHEMPRGEGLDGSWAYGANLDFMRELCAYWTGGYDWRKAEAALNAFPQFTATVEDIDLHFYFEKGSGPSPKPIILSHGWPGSVFEFLKIIPMLTEPASHGGDARDAFTVIAPSLPGYGLSFKPGQPRFGVEEIADIFAHLMTDVLGYPRFAAQGGDWGAFITSRLGYKYPDRLAGIHVNLLSVRRDPKLLADPAPEEQVFRSALEHFLKEETGYQWIQGTKPQTLAFALNDSPVGLAAWLVEKFRSWTDCAGNPENALTRDEMLADISFYWFTGAIGSSFWPYYARMHRPWPIPEGATVDVPMGYAEFPREIVRPPRSVAERLYTDIRRWTTMSKGGHFAALEQPAALAYEIREFFRPLRNT